MNRIGLNENWRLHEAPLSWGRAALSRVLSIGDDWMECNLPSDVHMPLQAYGRIKNVVEAGNSFAAEWIERRSWWYHKEFDVAPEYITSEAIELTLESLDAYADIFLNGEWLGTHKSAFYPFTVGVAKILRSGLNTLDVRITTGLEQVSDADMAEINWACSHEESNGCPERGDRRRPFVRKPQYSIGWDWGPKAVSCGIVKGAYISFYQKTAIRARHVWTEAINGADAKVRVSLEIEQLHPFATRDADVEISILRDGRECATLAKRDLLLTSGLNYIDFAVTINDAELWWPAGSGEQPLYELRARVVCEDHIEEAPATRFGIRTLALDVSRVDEKRRNFFLIVNGVRVFCKGGDWIPADSVYARVTREKYTALIDEARAANFNMLRVWGGGLYEPDVFFEACDERGILLWHDMMFGCSAYPDHLEEFRTLVEREVNYQIARLRNHPCLAIWCGNNENHWIFNPKFPGLADLRNEKQYGLFTANNQISAAVRALCPEIPFWNSSPYGGEEPNSDDSGDVHYWGQCMMNPDMAKRIEPKEYDGVRSRFVTEYGYPGPCPIESMEEYFGGESVNRNSKIWKLHTNTFEKSTVNAGIEKHYLDRAASLSLPDYILYAGMVQSLMLGYSLEAIRFKDYCGGGLFWMYNDTWGEVGWTIVDYYLRRKISFYGVKRAFAPVKLTLREVAGEIVLQGINDTPEAISFRADVGWMAFDGSRSRLTSERITLAARSREYIGRWPMPDADFRAGAFVVLPESEALEPAALRMLDTRKLRRADAMPRVIEALDEGDCTVFKLVSDAFIHGVYADTALPCSDNYFDMYPGRAKTVRIYGAKADEIVWKRVK